MTLRPSKRHPALATAGLLLERSSMLIGWKTDCQKKIQVILNGARTRAASVRPLHAKCSPQCCPAKPEPEGGLGHPSTRRQQRRRWDEEVRQGRIHGVGRLADRDRSRTADGGGDRSPAPAGTEAVAGSSAGQSTELLITHALQMALEGSELQLTIRQAGGPVIASTSDAGVARTSGPGRRLR